MESEIITTVGKIAGIGGIALGTLLLLFREFIRKNIFPNLTKNQSYNLLKIFLFLIWSVAVLGLAAWIFVGQVEQANPAKTQKLELLEDITANFTNYITQWQRLRVIAGLQQEKKGEITNEQLERKDQFLQERNSARDHLLNKLSIAKLLYKKEVIDLIEKFEGWDRSQIDSKYVWELPPIENWDEWNKKIIASMKKESGK